MAKVNVCDVCKHIDKVLVESMYRRGYTGYSKIDVCEKHQDYPMGNNPEEFMEKYFKLIRGELVKETI